MCNKAFYITDKLQIDERATSSFHCMSSFSSPVILSSPHQIGQLAGKDAFVPLSQVELIFSKQSLILKESPLTIETPALLLAPAAQIVVDPQDPSS